MDCIKMNIIDVNGLCSTTRFTYRGLPLQHTIICYFTSACFILNIIMGFDLERFCFNLISFMLLRHTYHNKTINIIESYVPVLQKMAFCYLFILLAR